MFVKLKDNSTVKTAKMVSVENIIYLVQSSVFGVIWNDFWRLSIHIHNSNGIQIEL